MKCPLCSSTDVQPVQQMTAKTQMMCSNCQLEGTLKDFGAEAKYNIGLVTEYSNSGIAYDHLLFNFPDYMYAVGFTIHQIDGQVVRNVWIRRWGVWLKYLPEVISDGDLSNPALLIAEEMTRFLNHPEVKQESLNGNFFEKSIQIMLSDFQESVQM